MNEEVIIKAQILNATIGIFTQALENKDITTISDAEVDAIIAKSKELAVKLVNTI